MDALQLNWIPVQPKTLHNWKIWRVMKEDPKSNSYIKLWLQKIKLMFADQKKNFLWLPAYAQKIFFFSSKVVAETLHIFLKYHLEEISRKSHSGERC